MNIQPRGVSSALISTDESFRATVVSALGASERAISLTADLSVTFGSIGKEEVKVLKEADPQLVILDLSEEPEMGIRFARFLADQHPGRRFIAVGPTLTSDLLLEAMRAGVNEYLPKPVTEEAFADSLAQVVRKITPVTGNAEAAEKKPGEILSVFSVKGGSGSA